MRAPQFGPVWNASRKGTGRERELPEECRQSVYARRRVWFLSRSEAEQEGCRARLFPGRSNRQGQARTPDPLMKSLKADELWTARPLQVESNRPEHQEFLTHRRRAAKLRAICPKP